MTMQGDVARRETTSCGAITWRISGGKVQVLLIKQFSHRNRWGVPKGHVDLEKGESLADCARREVKEETGIDVELGDRLPDVHVNAGDERKTVVTWLARPVGPDEPKHDDPDNEVADARWFDHDDLPDVVAYQRALVERTVDALCLSARVAQR